jgi:hypothetical protein
VICNNDDENSLHIFFMCPSICNIWSICAFAQTVSGMVSKEKNVPSVIFQILQQLTNNEASLFAVVLWSI